MVIETKINEEGKEITTFVVEETDVATIKVDTSPLLGFIKNELN